MALTKVQALVAEISLLANGTTTIDIPTAAADINVDVAGLNVIDLGSTTITVDDLVTLVANKITSEEIDLSTVSGAAGTMVTDATKMQVGTTSTHATELIANALPVLTAQTTGKVTLATVGTALDDLVDKNYVDNLISGVGGAVVPADIVSVQARPGYLQIPTSLGVDLIINWGRTGALKNACETVTFSKAFPNGFLIGSANRNETTASNEAAAHASTGTLTTMKVCQSGKGSTVACDWIAIGY